MVASFFLIGVSSMANIEYALGSAIEMAKLVCCMDASFLKW